MRVFFTNKTAWILTGIIFFLHFLPYLLFPGDAYIRIHDTLEGEWIWLHLLDRTGQAWNFSPDATVMPVMNGLPRSAMPTGLSVMMVLVTLFGTYGGYVVNYMLVHIIGFMAMYVFLKKHLMTGEENKPLVLLVSLIFSLVPVYTPFGISVMGQPFLLHVFILAYQKKIKPVHYLGILAFPLYASIVWCGIPVLVAGGIAWIYLAVKNKNLHVHFLSVLGILGLSFIAVNYNIIQLSVFPPQGFVSHRTAYNLYMFHGPEFGTLLVDFFHQFFTIHYHVGTLLTLPLFLAAILLWNKNLNRLLLVITALVIFQAGYGFFEYYIGDHIGFIKSFRLNRFNILLPMLWMIVAAKTVMLWKDIPWLKKTLPVFFITMLLIAAFGNDEILNNYRRIAGVYHLPTYKEYMAEKEFNIIKEYIGADPSTYRVACIGMNPSILQYNGFYTLDGLQSVYDLHYKNEFRKIIANELAKDRVITQYFDGWGNRCFIYTAMYGKEWDSFLPHQPIVNRSYHSVDLDPEAFRNLGGLYIVSPIHIDFERNAFIYKMGVTTPGSYWGTLYLYKVNDDEP